VCETDSYAPESTFYWTADRVTSTPDNSSTVLAMQSFNRASELISLTPGHVVSRIRRMAHC